MKQNIKLNVIFLGDFILPFQNDEQRIQQILINLLSNSIKFTNQGEITITVQELQDAIQFNVSDTGVGMTEFQLIEINKILSLPTMCNINFSNKSSCLGLTVSEQLINHMNNFELATGLQINSTLNQGSSITFTIQSYNFDTKYINAYRKSISSEKFLNTQSGQSCKKVLIVDDDCFNLAALSGILSKMELNFKKAYNGNQAVEIIKKFYSKEKNKNQSNKGYSLILMDYEMPIMNGVEATKQLKQLIAENIIPKIPIIGCTAFSSTNQVMECFNSGMDEVLIKPISFNKIKNLLVQWQIK